MPKRITIAPHLSLEELEHRYRQAKNPIERSHYQIIWLLASGRRSEDVAAITGYSRNWIYELVWGYNRIGPETLGDGRQDNPGAEALLNDVQQANLWQALKGAAPDGGLWNGRKVAEYLSELIGQAINRQQGWEYLKQMRMRLRVPRPAHSEADPDEQDAWKKKTRLRKSRESRANTQTPPSKFGVKMNIGLGCTLLCGVSGWNKENNPLPKSTRSENGCGYKKPPSQRSVATFCVIYR